MVECVVLLEAVVVLAVVVELLVGRCSKLTCVSETKQKLQAKFPALKNKLKAGQAWAGVLVKYAGMCTPL